MSDKDTKDGDNEREIFEEALRRGPASRRPYLDEKCRGKPELRIKLERLLAAHDSLPPESWIFREPTVPVRPVSRALEPGMRIDTYEILDVAGIGGMGEVYRARDLSLPTLDSKGKEVAIKSLPETFSRDPKRAALFKMEAVVLASLDHDNIGKIRRVIEWNGARLLILEWVAGETLADRIARGPISLADSLRIARQIADALEYAHEKGQGIVHRDLKPANIKIVGGEHVKVLDFGLAKVLDFEWEKTSLSQTVTYHGATTETGSSAAAPAHIMGTAAYMSPEQAIGKSVDQRSDIWAFGCLLYEMLTGKALFRGKTVGEVLDEVIKGEADFSWLPASTPPNIRRLLRRCLQKDRKRRLRHIADARIEIEEPEQEPASTLHAIPARMTRREAIGWISAAGMAATAGAIGWWSLEEKNREISIYPGNGMVLTGPKTATLPIPQFAISPDGKRIVFAAASPQKPPRPRLWIRGVDKLDTEEIPGTEGASGPFWSPDGKWIAFFANEELKRVPSDLLGKAESLAKQVNDPRGGTWNGNTILYAKGRSEIFIIEIKPNEKKEAYEVTKRDDKKGSHRWPQFLPDGEHFLYSIRSGKAERSGIWIGSVKSMEERTMLLPEVDSNAIYSRTGHIFYLDEDQLKALEFNPETFKMGAPKTVVVGVGRSTQGSGAMSVSDYGDLAWAGPITQFGQLTWYGERGVQGAIIAPKNENDEYTDFRLSHGGNALAATLADHKKGSVNIHWIENLNEPANRERTLWKVLLPAYVNPNSTINANTLWSNDDTAVRFRSNPSGMTEIYEWKRNGASTADLQSVLPDSKVPPEIQFMSLAPTDWGFRIGKGISETDGEFLFSVPNRKNGYDLWHIDKGEGKEILDDVDDQIHANLSPDGRFVAYSSYDPAHSRYEVYIRSMPIDRTKSAIQVSSDSSLPDRAGGSEPRWKQDGKELFFLSEDRNLIAVTIGEDGKPGKLRLLFQTNVPRAVNAHRTNYVPDREGKRFLVNTLIEDQPTPFITVYTNWQEKLRRAEVIP